MFYQRWFDAIDVIYWYPNRILRAPPTHKFASKKHLNVCDFRTDFWLPSTACFARWQMNVQVVFSFVCYGMYQFLGNHIAWLVHACTSNRMILHINTRRSILVPRPKVFLGRSYRSSHLFLCQLRGCTNDCELFISVSDYMRLLYKQRANAL